jgi:predicted transcriptional regulator
MSARDAVQAMLKPLRPDVSLHEVTREIAFIAGIREGFAQLDRGVSRPIEEIETRIPKWAGT